MKSQNQELIKVRFLKVFIRFFFVVIFFRCNLKPFDPNELHGKYVSSILRNDTLCIVKIENKFYFYRKYKEFNNSGIVEINTEDEAVDFCPWKCQGESDIHYCNAHCFSTTYNIKNDTLYIFQTDANSDIIKEFYYKKISEYVDEKIKKELRENTDSISEKVRSLFIKY